MPYRILLADDDPLLLQLVQLKLETGGYEVFTADAGDEALHLAESIRPDVIVLDAMMPGLDGFDVLRRLRNDQNLCRIPVVMLTARKHDRDVVLGLSLGAREYLVKPFIPDELVLRLERICAAQAKQAHDATVARAARRSESGRTRAVRHSRESGRIARAVG